MANSRAAKKAAPAAVQPAVEEREPNEYEAESDGGTPPPHPPVEQNSDDDADATPPSAGLEILTSAPLTAPPEDKIHPAAQLRTSEFSIIAVMDERHLGIVDGDDNPVLVDDVLVQEGPKATAYRAKQRVFEKSTMPGTEQPRRRLLYGEGAIVPRDEVERLREAVEARQAEPAS